MTQEEAIKYLQGLYPNGGHCWLDEQRIEAISMAIKALQEEPVSNDLKEAACEYDNSHIDDNNLAFKAGAKWQKEQTIYKACEWLLKNDSYAKPTELLVRDFKKAMEE